MTATTPLGTTGMEISRIGFGAWAAGGGDWKFGWGPQDDADSVATVLALVERGVNWVDTAPAYGLGHSEEVVGKALAQLPEADRPFVFTKVGLVWTDTEDPAGSPRKVMRAEHVRRDVEASLRRLGVDRIDLLQVHWPGDGALAVPEDGPDPLAERWATPLAEYWQTMAELKREGLVRAIGLSNHDVAQLAEAEAIAHVDTLQPPFSLLQRDAVPELAWCADHGTGAIVYQPLHSGLLTGAFSRERAEALPAGDWRRGAPAFTTDLDRNLALVDALRPIAAAHRTTVASVAIAWALTVRGVTGAIVGARRPDQLHDWIDAASLELAPEDLDAIAAAIEATGAGSGPARP
ncbi:aldo/keto reductase [Saccharothrix saharensis]|uniref:aldo/keto reductase n=1 Tax=Saccharothrix saharensis TaxID=571190 RepID=UPI0036A74FC7